MLGQKAHVENLHEMTAAGVVQARRRTGEQLGQDQGVAEQIGGGLLAQAALPRYLDGDGSHEAAAKILLGPEDGAEDAAGLHVEQLVLAVECAAEQALFQRRSTFHGWPLSCGSRLFFHYTAWRAGGVSPLLAPISPLLAPTGGLPPSLALAAAVNPCNIIIPGPSRRREAFIPIRSQRKDPIMVERRIELNRRYHRKKKMTKLKARLAAAKNNHERELILKKIHVLSPWWKEPAPQS